MRRSISWALAAAQGERRMEYGGSGSPPTNPVSVITALMITACDAGASHQFTPPAPLRNLFLTVEKRLSQLGVGRSPSITTRRLRFMYALSSPTHACAHSCRPSERERGMLHIIDLFAPHRESSRPTIQNR
jgi:hypothetical protein